MGADSETIEVNGQTVREGTAIYDTEFDRVLWIANIDEYEITVEVTEEYEDDELVWWSPDEGPTRVVDGSSMAIVRFRSLVEDGRFEVGPQPVGPDIAL